MEEKKNSNGGNGATAVGSNATTEMEIVLCNGDGQTEAITAKTVTTQDNNDATITTLTIRRQQET